MTKLETRLVGVSMNGRQSVIQRALARRTANENAGVELFSGMTLVLRPEPENQYDEYAVAVDLRTEDGDEQLGYLPRMRCPYCQLAFDRHEQSSFERDGACPKCGAILGGCTATDLLQFNKFIGTCIENDNIIGVEADFRVSPGNHKSIGVHLWIELAPEVVATPEAQAQRSD